MSLLSPVGEIVRRHDPDRYFTALFAPAEHRETLFTLYAFNHELARAREAVREPYMALIRLQWWREVIEGARRRHEVAGPLGEALDAGRLDAAVLAGMVDAREAEAGPIEGMAAFEEYVLGTAGGVMVAAARALGMADAESLRRPGAAYGVAGVLRSVGAHARQGRCLLPEDVLAEAGLTGGDVIAAPDGPALAPVVGALRGLACDWLGEVTRPEAGLAAALPTTLARRDLRRGGRSGGRSLSDRIAVLWAAARGRA